MKKLILVVSMILVTVGFFSQDIRGTIKVDRKYRGLSDEMQVIKVLIFEVKGDKWVGQYVFRQHTEGYENNFPYIILNLSNLKNKITMIFDYYEDEEDPLISKFLNKKFNEALKNNMGKRYTPLVAEIPTKDYYLRVIPYIHSDKDIIIEDNNTINP